VFHNAFYCKHNTCDKCNKLLLYLLTYLLTKTRVAKTTRTRPEPGL